MSDSPPTAPATVLWLRAFAWTIVAATFAFVLNAYLTFWQGWPGTDAVFTGGAEGTGMALAAIQLALYAAAVAVPVVMVRRTAARGLRTDARALSRIVTFLVRWAFWSVLLVGIADIAISFMRVEGLLAGVVGQATAEAWGFNQNRAPQVHFPLVGIGLLLAIFTRTLGFPWLALFVVLAELSIVLTRFIFSYEQAFQADLVRFWYGALFLFASAHTLAEDGHVRVDVFYANLRTRTQGLFNAIGCLLMGILFCWVILWFGMSGRSSIIVAPILSYEITQAGFGMYVKYMMAGFLAVFGVTMMIQFASYLLDSWADLRGEPGGAPHHVHGSDGDHVAEV